jgi:hypothetical protein
MFYDKITGFYEYFKPNLIKSKIKGKKMNQETKLSSTLHHGATLKAFIIGILLCLFLSIAEPYTVLINSCSGFCSDFICAGAIVLFFVLTGLINVVLGLINRKLSLNSSELIVVYSMMLVACAIPTWGLMANFVPIMTGFKYWDRPAWGFSEYLYKHIPEWFIVQDADACKYLFEGLPKGMSIPWAAWIAPLCVWSVFFLALYFVSVCMMVIMRKQWVENERLVFPLNVIPLEMVQDDEKKSLIKPFFRNKLMWIGFFTSFCFLAWNGISHFVPLITPIRLSRWLPLLRMTTDMTLFFSFPIIGFTYFVNLDVAASFWIFHILYRLFYGFWRITGFGLEGESEAFMSTSHSASFLAMGAMIVLVVYGLFLARRHIKSVFKKAFTGDSDIDDSQEALSYRTAVFGTIIGSIVLIMWLVNSGLNLPVSVFYLGITFVCLIGLSRIMAEGGFGFARLQSTPPAFVRLTMPASTVGPGGLASLSGAWSYNADVRTTVMTSTIHGFQLADSTNTAKKRWFLMIAAAVLVSFFGSMLTIIILGYKYGGGGFQGGQSWFFTGMPEWTWRVATERLKNPGTIIDIFGRWLWTSIGAALMFFLMFMRHRFQWWPIHYLGLPIADTYVMRYAFLSVFIGWLLKMVILKYGGMKTYRKLKPLFIGLILGQIISASVITMISAILGLRTEIPVFIGIP